MDGISGNLAMDLFHNNHSRYPSVLQTTTLNYNDENKVCVFTSNNNIGLELKDGLISLCLDYRVNLDAMRWIRMRKRKTGKPPAKIAPSQLTQSMPLYISLYTIIDG